MIRRLKQVYSNMTQVLSMNRRNLEYIYNLNRRKDYALADDKLVAKEVLGAAGVPVPDTYATYAYFYDLRNLERDLEMHDEFVIKPARGSGGGGILVIAGRNGDKWYGPGGREYDLDDLCTHIGDIIFGIHSFGLSDRAIVEQRIVQHPEIDQLCYEGLADVRVVVCKNKPVMSMIRLPTRSSGGRANLHQGAIGVGIDIETGITINASLKGEPLTVHPDNGRDLLGFSIPKWSEITEAAIRASRSVPLDYLGVDVALSTDGPKVLEINVRPGIEIQNVNGQGMREKLERQEKML